MAKATSNHSSVNRRYETVHRWQGRQSIIGRIAQQLTALRTLKSALLIAGFMGMLGFLIWVLLFAPKRTPFVSIQAANYEWPFPPMAWSAEDLVRFSKLDGETLSIADYELRVDHQGDLDGMLDVIVRHSKSAKVGADRPVIVYVTMHGIVADDTAYLVPSRSLPYDLGESSTIPTEWVSVQSFLSRVDEKLPKRRKLVVLDCQRIQANWHLGLLENDFSTNVEKWWSGFATSHPNLSVLCAAGGGQRGLTSQVLQGSVFGYYFRQGIAGAADGFNDGGEKDSQVSVCELDRYLQDHVERWARLNRAEGQVPLLLSGIDDYILAHSLSPSSLRELMSEQSQLLATAAIDAVPDRRPLWELFDKLRHDGLYRYEPQAWSELENKLIWLEQLATSGPAYRRLAIRTHDDLLSWLPQVESRVSAARQKPSLREHLGLLIGNRDAGVGGLAVRTLPLAEYFDTLAPDQVDAIRREGNNFLQSPNAANLRSALRNLDNLRAAGLVSSQFLRMVERYRSDEIWQRSDSLTQLLALRRQIGLLAVPREPTGSPGDERGHYWVRAFLDATNTSRRAAEDGLIVSSQPDLTSHLLRTKQLTAQAAAARNELERALRIRDHALAEAGYLAQWLAHPANRPIASKDKTFPASRDEFVALVTACNSLSELIDDHTHLAVGSSILESRVDAIVQAATQVANAHHELKDQLDSAVRRLLQQGADQERDAATSLRRAEALLHNPLISADLRGSLRTFYSKDSARLCQHVLTTQEDKEAASEEVTATDHELLSYEKWMHDGSTSHPLLLLTRLGATGAGSGENLGTNRQWRSALTAILADVGQADQVTTRAAWSQTDQRLRAIAPIWHPAPTIDPVVELRRLDHHALLFWHAQQSFLDFWGPAGGADNYFCLATNDYLDSARRVLAGASTNQKQQQLRQRFRQADREQLSEQVKQANLDARYWVSTAADDIVLLEPEDELPIEVTVSDIRADNAVMPNSGTAAVVVRRQGERVDDIRFQTTGAVSLPVGTQRLQATIPAKPADMTSSSLNVETVFRGHEFSSGLNVGGIGGVVVEHKPTEYPAAQVVLHSPWKKLDIVFVLDASHSMNDSMNGDESRLDSAKRVLGQLLADLASRQNVRVGVWMLGHRLGWSTDRPLRDLISPSYSGDIPTDFTPDGDVEQVAPLAAFDYAAAGRIFGRLEAVQNGWGQSPLYLALEKTLTDDFSESERMAKKHLIVLTDGRNYQFRPNAEDYSSKSNVVQAWGGRDIQIHILGMAMDEHEASQAMPEFSSLAGQTGGSYENLSSSNVVYKTLKRILQIESCQLASSAGEVVDEQELGRPLAAENMRDWYDLRYQGMQEPLFLQGGELLNFFVDSPEGTIRAFPYNQDVVQSQWLTYENDDTQSDTLLQIHQPLRDQGNVRFALSLQRSGDSDALGNPTWRWTPRPAEAWIEIVPISDSAEPAGQTYHFYDLSYLENKPVPVFELTAENWPAAADRARIRALFQPQASLSGESLLPPQSQQLGNVKIGDSVEVLPGIRVVVNSEQADAESDLVSINVIEYHQAERGVNGKVASVGSIKVESPDLTEHQLLRVTRQFDEDHGIVVHRFYYSVDDSEVATLRTANFRIYAKNALRLGSLVAKPLGVDISEAGNLIPILTGPPASRR